MLLMYSMYFVVVTLGFQLLAKHSSAALPSEQFVNNLSVHYTPTHMIERVMCAVNAVDILNIFCSCYAIISAGRAKHCLAALPCAQFVKKYLT